MHGLYLFWWVQVRHVSPAAVATILAAGDLAVTLFEIPTGWFADRFGHRRSLIVGSAIQVAGMLCCWLGQGVPGVLGATLLVAFGDGFRSGADQALLYQSCTRLGRSGDFQKIDAKARAIQLAAMVALVITGGAIVEAWGFHAGWFAETLLSAVGLGLAFAMVDPAAHVAALDERTAPVSSGGGWSGPYWWVFLTLTAPAALLSGAETATSFWAQTGAHAGPRELTVFVAVLALAEAAGSMLALRLPALGARAQLVLAGIGSLVLTAAIAHSRALQAGAVGLALLQGVAHPLRAAAIQRLAADRMRAQAASIASACDKACATIALMLAGRGYSR